MNCERCQHECYDLLDYNLSPAAERIVMAHIASCPACQQFLEAEQERMRQWPRLFDSAAQNIALPTDVVERVAHAMELSRHAQATRFITAIKPQATSWKLPWLTLAASLVVLLGIAGLFWAGSALHPYQLATQAKRLPNAIAESSLTLLSSHLAVGIELPPSIPGRVKLASGEMRVKLGSGVELSLLGPVDLMVENPMLLWLEQGDILASVPPQAVGFQVQTATLDIWDFGTIFSVSAKEGGDSVFVFKGNVQVNEASGDAVDACQAGEGVHSEKGRTPFKVAADFKEAKTQFHAVSGKRSLEDIAHSFAAAERIITLWMDRYLPKTEEERLAYFAKEAARLRDLKRPAFSTQAWVRPSVPLLTTQVKRLSPLQKEENMTTTRAVAAMAASVTLLGAGMSGATSAPIQVDTAAYNNRHWMTVFTNEVPLQWDWPATATSATLAINGMNSSLTTNFTLSVSNCLWQAFAGVTPAKEDVCDLTLTFYKDGSTVVNVLTSKLAVVQAAFGPTAVDTARPENKWNSLTGNVVLAYDGAWTAATAPARITQLVIAKEGGQTETNTLADASGYMEWKLTQSAWGNGTFNLALTFPETVPNAWTATLTRLPSGTVIIVF